MKKLIFKFWSQTCWYNFVADIDETHVAYKVKSSYFNEVKEGVLDENSTKTFIEDIKNSEFESWEDAYYPNEPLLDDAGQFNICYVDDETNIFFTVGNELCMPDKLFYLALAIDSCDQTIGKIVEVTACLGED